MNDSHLNPNDDGPDKITGQDDPSASEVTTNSAVVNQPEQINTSLNNETKEGIESSSEAPTAAAPDSQTAPEEVDISAQKTIIQGAEIGSGPLQKGVLIFVKNKLVERSPEIELVPRQRLDSSTRRSFLVYGAAMTAAASGLWWMLPDEVKSKLGFNSKTGRVKEDFLRNILSFDDEVARKVFPARALVPTYTSAEMTEVPNNYAGATPSDEYLNTWKLSLKGLVTGTAVLTADQLRRDFEHHEQITRLVCVEGWSAISSWGGLRFRDLIKQYPPAAGTKWIQLRSDVNLDGDGNSDPYFVSFDLASAMHPQTLLATHHRRKLLELEHGAPLRLLAPTKLGLKNIKAITSVAYLQSEPDDYWNKYGYSYYDGI